MNKLARTSRSRSAMSVTSLAFCAWLTLSGFSGFVISVHDGDTLKLKSGQTIRLDAIDAPEIKQAYGVEAREKLTALVLNKEVEITEAGTDRYGRTIGRVTVDNRDVNLEMVRSGHAWWFRKYSKSAEIRDAEVEARSEKRGLWGDTEAEAPWEFRKRGKADDKSNGHIEKIRRGSESSRREIR